MEEESPLMSPSTYLCSFTMFLSRQETDNICQLKQLTANKKIPLGLLREGPQAIQKGDLIKMAVIPDNRLSLCYVVSILFRTFRL